MCLGWGELLHFYQTFPTVPFSTFSNPIFSPTHHFPELNICVFVGGGDYTFIRVFLGCALIWVCDMTYQIRLETSDFVVQPGSWYRDPPPPPKRPPPPGPLEVYRAQNNLRGLGDEN